MQLLDTAAAHPFRVLAVLVLGTGLAHGLRGPRVIADHAELKLAVDEPIIEPVSARIADDAPPAARSELDFVLTADGASWVALTDVDVDEVQTAGKPRLIQDDYTYGTIEKVRTLPESARAWRGREVVVNETCHDTLEQFALITRVSGDPTYTDDGERGQWTASSIHQKGSAVLVAKLSRCHGTYARPAKSVPVGQFEVVADDAAVAQAHVAMLASEYGIKAADDWKRERSAKKWTDDASFSAIVARDAKRGTLWVSAHMHTPGVACGEPSANFWGLFRVEPDGMLTQVSLTELSDVDSIDTLVDLDGDGTPEALGTATLPAAPIALDATGTVTQSLSIPFFGCPC